MEYTWRIKIPSCEGLFVKNLQTNNLHTQLRKEDKENWYNLNLLYVAWTSLLADSPVGLKPNRVINQFLTTLVNDPKKVILTYSELYDKLVSQCLSDNGNITVPFLNEFKKTPIFREYLVFYKTQNTSVLKFILTFLTFGKKSYFKSEELEVTALRKWLQVEERLAKLALPDFLVNMRAVATWLLKDFQPDTFLPKHGPGAVSERGIRGLRAKNVNFYVNKSIHYLFLRKDNIFLTNEVDNVSLPTREHVNVIDDSRPARLKFVPKDMKSSRSICMEPIAVQWAQQGVRLWVEASLKRSILSNHVDLHDQTLNQEMARIGSKDLTLDTLDLSSASDSVHIDVIKAIIPNSLLKYLLCTRTREVELPDGSVFPIRKYAPMGSSLCFPIQTFLYSTIILMVGMARASGRDWRKPGCFDGFSLDQLYSYSFSRRYQRGSKAYHPFACYGDDLILDKRISSNVIEALNSLGFEVNGEKSFRDKQVYRESCGIHCFNGDDVTPMRFKIKKLSRKNTIDSIASVIDTCNRAFEYGYLNLRQSLINYILYCDISHGKGIINKTLKGKNPILFSNDKDESFCIVSDNPVNTHLRKRIYIQSDRLDKDSTSQRFQRDEVYRITLGPDRMKKLPKKFDNYFYTLWWRSRYEDRGMDGVEPSTIFAADVQGVDVKWVWSPT